MKAATSTVAQDTKKAVQSQFSHFYKVMGDKGTGQSSDVLAVIQKGGSNQVPQGSKK